MVAGVGGRHQQSLDSWVLWTDLVCPSESLRRHNWTSLECPAFKAQMVIPHIMLIDLSHAVCDGATDYIRYGLKRCDASQPCR